MTAGKTPGLSRKEGAACLGIGVKEHYKIRSVIERVFGEIKGKKRCSLQFDKLDTSFFF